MVTPTIKLSMLHQYSNRRGYTNNQTVRVTPIIKLSRLHQQSNCHDYTNNHTIMFTWAIKLSKFHNSKTVMVTPTTKLSWLHQQQNGHVYTNTDTVKSNNNGEVMACYQCSFKMKLSQIGEKVIYCFGHANVEQLVTYVCLQTSNYDRVRKKGGDWLRTWCPCFNWYVNYLKMDHACWKLINMSEHVSKIWGPYKVWCRHINGYEKFQCSITLSFLHDNLCIEGK